MYVVYALINRFGNNKVAIHKTEFQHVAHGVAALLKEEYAVDIEDCPAGFYCAREEKLSAKSRVRIENQLSSPEEWQIPIMERARQHEEQILKIERDSGNRMPAYLSINEILDFYGVDRELKDALRKRLERFRSEHMLDKRAYPLYLQGSGYGQVIAVHGTDHMYWRATPSSIIRKGDWKLMQFFESGKIELYNIKQDLSEKNDLADSHPEKLSELLKELKRWQSKTKAVIPTRLNPAFDPKDEEVKKKKTI